MSANIVKLNDQAQTSQNITMQAASAVSPDVLQKILTTGDIGGLNQAEQNQYLLAMCQSLELNPLTRPFQIIEFEGGKKIVYATKDCTEQLRNKNNLSLSIVKKEMVDDIYVVTARATMPNGRTDEDEGALPLYKDDGDWASSPNGKRYFKKNGKTIALAGADRANAIMKAVTKAKRRVTLSICGLGILDESELDTMPPGRVVNISEVKEEPKQIKNLSADDLEKKSYHLEMIESAQTNDELTAYFKNACQYAKERNDKSLYQQYLNSASERKKILLTTTKKPEQLDEDTQAYIDSMGDVDDEAV